MIEHRKSVMLSIPAELYMHEIKGFTQNRMGLEFGGYCPQYRDSSSGIYDDPFITKNHTYYIAVQVFGYNTFSLSGDAHG